MSLLLLQVSDISATGDIQCQDETAKAVQILYFYVWYYMLPYLSDQKLVCVCVLLLLLFWCFLFLFFVVGFFLVWKGLIHLSTFYFFQVLVNHILSGMCFAPSMPISNL